MAVDELGGVFIGPSIFVGNFPDICFVFDAAERYESHEAIKWHSLRSPIKLSLGSEGLNAKRPANWFCPLAR